MQTTVHVCELTLVHQFLPGMHCIDTFTNLLFSYLCFCSQVLAQKSLPSIAPTQLGKFHLSSNSNAIDFHSSSVPGALKYPAL